MRGQESQDSARFRAAGPEERAPAAHPLRPALAMAERGWRGLNPAIDRLSAGWRQPLLSLGRMPRARLLRALILCALAAFAAELAGCNNASPGTAHAPSSGAQSYNVVVSPTSLQAISVSAPQNSLPLGQSEQFSATGWYSDGTTEPLDNGEIWTSSDTNILAVDGNGLVIGMAVGSASVTAQDPVTQTQGTLSVTVTAAVLDALSVNPAGSTLPVGLAVPLTAAGHFSDGTSLALTTGVAWSSSDNSVAMVDAAGTVTGVSAGTVSIGAAYGGQSGTAHMTVSQP